MIEDPHVGLGHLMIAIAEPYREGLEAYHRWFERDHMYSAVLIGPGAFAAERYVATQDLKALRYPSDGGVFSSIDRGSFVALYYLVKDSVEEHYAWSYPQSARLAQAGRSNRDRELVLTWLCDYRGRVAREAESVPPEITLDHRHEGLVMVWLESASDERPAELARWLEEEYLPRSLRDSPIDQVLLFTPRDFPTPAEDVPITPGSIAPNPWTERGLLLLYFLDTSPADIWHEHFAPLGDAIALSERGRVTLAAPFLTTDRGTRAHLDELW